MNSGLIVCNGEFPSPDLLSREYAIADLRVAADGGASAFLRDGLTPDVVIGDLDSLPGMIPADWTIVKDPDQETNDLEKALKFMLLRGITQVSVLGAVGLRTDQTLKNLSVLMQFNPNFEKLIFKDDQFDIFVVPRTFSSPGIPGKTVSFFPISGRVQGITLAGFKYPLNNESLENGVRDGSSNEIISEELAVIYFHGTLIGFFER